MPGNDALWYKDAIFYEVHVRAFSDGDARWARRSARPDL